MELRYFQIEDTPSMAHWIDGPRTALIWGGPHVDGPLTEDDLCPYLKDANQPNSTRHVYKGCLSDGQIIAFGVLDLTYRDHEQGRLSRLIVDPKRRGQGLGQKLVSAMLEIGFDQFQLHRISLSVFDFNVAAVQCYETVGFVKEGVSRECRKFEDEFWNAYEMSILKPEWEVMRDRASAEDMQVLASRAAVGGMFP